MYHDCNSSNIKITGWNVRGLRKITKLKQVMSRIRRLKSKIIFLQETHMTIADLKRIQSRWPGQVIYACYKNYARGGAYPYSSDNSFADC